jgi:hypothetical protein
MTSIDSSRPGLSSPRGIARFVSSSVRVSGRKLGAALAIAAAMTASSQAATIYSWESGLDGWAGDTVNGYSVTTTSALGVTDGVSALQLTAPASGMWWSAGFSRNLGSSELSQIFNGASQVGMDMTYNPGSDTWYMDANLTLIVQGEKVAWTELAPVTIVKGATPTAATWSISPTMASDLATSSWGQLVLKLTYGNGGSAPSVFYVDNFTSDAVAVPEPASSALLLGLGVIVTGVARRRRRD